MLKPRISCPGLLIAVLAAFGGAARPVDRVDGTSRNITVSNSNQDARVVCEDAGVFISGSDNRIEIAGACGEIRISGSNNRIAVDLLPGGIINLSGSDNRVEYRLVERGPPPIVLQSGSNNSVRPARSGR